MIRPGTDALLDALDATWPAAETRTDGGWLLRRGLGGGNRVSAASGDGDIDAAVAGLAEWGQHGLFRLSPDQDALDRTLEERGYLMHEPVVFYTAPAEQMAGSQSHMAASYRVQPMLRVMEEIWAEGGIGPARLAIMARPTGPKQLFLSRAEDRPAGTAFAAIDGGVAMIHAIEVRDQFRRKGAAHLLIEGAARFAAENGAAWLALAVTETNGPARTLYEKLGMSLAGAYHYRIAPEARR